MRHNLPVGKRLAANEGYEETCQGRNEMGLMGRRGLISVPSALLVLFLGFVAAHSTRTTRLFVSHTRKVKSPEAETIRVPSGLKVSA